MRSAIWVCACALLMVGDARAGDEPAVSPLPKEPVLAPAGTAPKRASYTPLEALTRPEAPLPLPAPLTSAKPSGRGPLTDGAIVAPSGAKQNRRVASEIELEEELAPLGPTFRARIQAAPRAAGGGTAAVVPSSSLARRRAIEQALQTPLEWKADGRKTITLIELIEHVRATHRLSIRLDLPTLTAMYGPLMEAESSESCRPSTNSGTKSPSGKSASLKGAGPSAVAPPPPVPVTAYRPGAALRKNQPVPTGDGATSPVASSLAETYALEASVDDAVTNDAPARATPSATPRSNSTKPATTIRRTGGEAKRSLEEPGAARVDSTPPADRALPLDPAQPVALEGVVREQSIEVESTEAVAEPLPIDAAVARTLTGKSPVTTMPSAWLDDYDVATAEARRRDVPLVVFFRANWCAPCQKLEQEVLTDSEIVRRLRRDFVAVRVDIDQKQDLAKRLEVKSLPMLLILDAEGKKRNAHIGLSTAANLRDFLCAASTNPVNAANSATPTAPRSGTEVDSEPEGVATCPGCPAHEHATCDGEAAQSAALAFARIPIPTEALGLDNATIGTALTQLLQSITATASSGGESAIGLEMPLPIRLTNASDLDYLVQDDGVLITSRLNANIRKETRVYRLPTVADCPPEKIARLITRSVRPWSWRTQVNEMAEGLASKWSGGFRLPSSFNFDLGNGVKVASGQIKTPSKPKNLVPAAGAAPNAQSTEDADASSSNPANALSAETLNALGQFVIHGGATLFQAWLAALEVAHHADPPTATIETLPGLLVITQSQAAHREIADLLEQLDLMRNTNGEPRMSPRYAEPAKSTFDGDPAPPRRDATPKQKGN